MLAFIQCIREFQILYLQDIYVGNMDAYPRQTSIIVLHHKSQRNLTVLGLLPYCTWKSAPNSS